MRALNGSSETILRSQGFCKGSSAQLRGMQLKLYVGSANSAFDDAHAMQMSWDGSCHGGKNVFCGAAIDPDRLCGGYLKPEAAL